MEAPQFSWRKIVARPISSASDIHFLGNDNWVQLGMLKGGGFPKDFEVLRMEVCLNTQRKIKTLRQSLGLTVPEIFRSAFRKDIAQTVLL